MSGIVVVFHRDGRPADTTALARMMDSVAYRGPDGRGIAAEGSVALGFLRLCTTPEAFVEPMPLGAEGAPTVLFDGRLDEREVLTAALTTAGEAPVGPGDGELVLRAYRVWGERFAEHLLGEFVAVVWDPRRRVLVCARDPMGKKPLCYYVSERLFACASEVSAILEHPAVQAKPNEGMVGEYLAGAITSTEDTLYDGIQRLPPGHRLVVTPDSIRKERFFAFDLAAEESRGSEQEHAERWRAIFRDAVRCRLRAPGPVGLALSGGLDSSSIAVVAAGLLREQPALPAIETFSHVFPGMPCDETRYIREVAACTGMPAHELPPTGTPAGADVEALARRHRTFPGYPNCLNAHGLVAAAASRGVRVLMTGAGGDDWLQGAYPAHGVIEHLARLELRAGLAMLTSARDARVECRRALGLLRQQMIPRRLWRAIAPARRLRHLPAWLDPGFCRRVALGDRLAVPPPLVPLRYMGRRYAFETATSAHKIHALEQEEAACAALGIELREPFDDRRLATFALSLPENERVRRGLTKVVLRRALDGTLPPAIARRKDKAGFSHWFREALAHHRTILVDPRALVESGWIRGGGHLSAAWQQDTGEKMWALWMAVGVSCWLRVGFGASHGTI